LSVTDGIGQTPCPFEHYLVKKTIIVSQTGIVYVMLGNVENFQHTEHSAQTWAYITDDGYFCV